MPESRRPPPILKSLVSLFILRARNFEYPLRGDRLAAAQKRASGEGDSGRVIEAPAVLAEDIDPTSNMTQKAVEPEATLQTWMAKPESMLHPVQAILERENESQAQDHVQACFGAHSDRTKPPSSKLLRVGRQSGAGARGKPQ
jgi:hypothetical protein